MYLLIYSFWLDLLNQNEHQSMIIMVNKMKTIINVSFIILLLLVIILIFLTFFIFIRNIKNDCKNFIHIRKLFQINENNI